MGNIYSIMHNIVKEAIYKNVKISSMAIVKTSGGRQEPVSNHLKVDKCNFRNALTYSRGRFESSKSRRNKLLKRLRVVKSHFPKPIRVDKRNCRKV